MIVIYRRVFILIALSSGKINARRSIIVHQLHRMLTYTYRRCHVPSAGPEPPGWWPSPTSSASPSSSSCPAACPIYFHSSPWTDLFCRLLHTHTHTTFPRDTPHGSTLSFFFSDGTLVPSAPLHLAKEVLPSTLSFPPSLELNSFFWYRFGIVAHCTSLVRSWSTARPVA